MRAMAPVATTPVLHIMPVKVMNITAPDRGCRRSQRRNHCSTQQRKRQNFLESHVVSFQVGLPARLFALDVSATISVQLDDAKLSKGEVVSGHVNSALDVLLATWGHLACWLWRCGNQGNLTRAGQDVLRVTHGSMAAK